MANEDFRDPPSRKVSGVLVVLWRKILLENRLNRALTPLIARYLNDTNRVGNSKRKNKATLKANIFATDMTFKTFIDLVFNLLKATRLDISIKVTFVNGKSSTHSVSIDARNVQEGEDDDPGGTESEDDN